MRNECYNIRGISESYIIIHNSLNPNTEGGTMKKPIEPLVRQDLVHPVSRTSITTIMLILTFLLLSFAQNTYGDCKINAVESHYMYKYLDRTPNKLDGLNNVHKNVCSRVKDGELTLEVGNFIQHAFILRWATCRDREVNPQVSKVLRDEDTPIPIYRVFESYCRDKWPYTGTGIEWEKELIDSAFWLQDELLCQKMRYISYSDSWIEVLRPKDFDSVKQLEKAAISICNDLRNDKIGYNEAKYRWKTELLWFDDHLPKEAAQHYGKQLIKPITKLMEKIFGE